MINKKTLFGIMLFSLISGQIHTPPPPPVPNCDIDALKAVKMNYWIQSDDLKDLWAKAKIPMGKREEQFPTLLKLWHGLVESIVRDHTISLKIDAIDQAWQTVLDSLLNEPRNENLRKIFDAACLQSEDVSSDFLDLGYAMISGSCEVDALKDAIINKKNQTSVIQKLWNENQFLALGDNALISYVWEGLVLDKLNDASMIDATLQDQKKAVEKLWESLSKSLISSKNKDLHKKVSIECIKSQDVADEFLQMATTIINNYNANKPSPSGGGNTQPTDDDIAKLVNIIEVVAALVQK